MSSTTTRIGFSALLLALAVGAGPSPAAPPTPGGPTVTLTLAHPETRGRPTSLIAESFAARARALSKGKLVVKIDYEAGVTRDNQPVGEIEANLISLVRNGSADLALAATRSFDAQGVRSFQALQAPFLITTDAGMARVTTGAIATRLQSGLGRIGLTGLGLAPEGLRRVFGFGQALVSPRDFAGARIRTIPSRQTAALLRALGARPVDLNGDAYAQAVESGAVQGAESSLAIVADSGAPAPTVTAGNIALFPKVDVFVGNADAMKRLTSAQRTVLREAAADARAWAVAHLTERGARIEYCKAAGTVVTAPSGAIAALRAKAAPVLAAMRRDTLTRSLIRQIGRHGSAGPNVPPCSPAGLGGANPGPTVTSVIPAGVYRKAVTEKQLLAAGESPSSAKFNAGVWTLTATADGAQSIAVDSPYPEYTTTCDKRKMSVRRGVVVIELRGNGSCGGDFAVAWKLVPGGIEFTRVALVEAGRVFFPPGLPPALRLFFDGVVWKKVR
jgi:TRAP-type C4-dicarboxylate transport system substrate-binding protein